MTKTQMRRRAEAMIEELIDILDAIDGDPDFEIDADLDVNPTTLQPADRRQVKHVSLRRAA